MILLNANMEEGLVILLVGMVIVFISLLLLFSVFQFILPAILSLKFKKPKPQETAPNEDPGYTSGEEMAAVATAVYLFLEEAHDEENAILTINQIQKSYSPWSSKIYTTHRFNNR